MVDNDLKDLQFLTKLNVFVRFTAQEIALVQDVLQLQVDRYSRNGLNCPCTISCVN
jgi:hypothetical protein